MVVVYRSKATLKKKFVSCPAGGRNYGQSGGRKLFFLGGKKMMKFLTRKQKCKIKKKSSHSSVIFSPGRWTGNNIFSKGGLSNSRERG